MTCICDSVWNLEYILVNPKRPKIAKDKILKVIQSTGISYSTRDPDIAIIVGGDGTFHYYGRNIQLLWQAWY